MFGRIINDRKSQIRNDVLAEAIGKYYAQCSRSRHYNGGVKRKQNNNEVCISLYVYASTSSKGDLEFAESRCDCDDVDELLTVRSRI